jgi:hypothetical protein
MTPFVVQGDDLTVTILARSNRDRRYGEKFSDDVIKVAYDTMGDSTGKGLIIVAKPGEPHPIHIFRKFQAMAAAGQLHPEVAQHADDLDASLRALTDDMSLEDEDDIGITFDMLINALPLPLDGVGAKVYQLAWKDRFDLDAVERLLAGLTPADLEGRSKLSRYDWVYYLPPRNAFDKVLKEVLPLVMKEEKMGLFKRAAARSAIFVFKPVIRKAVEGMRMGMLYMTVLQAQSDYSDEDIKALTGAYVQVLMPDFKFNGRTENKRALEAIEEQKRKNLEYAKDPFVSPERLADFDPQAYVRFVGDYIDEGEKKVSHRFRMEDRDFTWTYKDHDPMPFYPAGENLFVIEDGKMTIEFLEDENGNITGVEERWHRRRKTVPKE